MRRLRIWLGVTTIAVAVLSVAALRLAAATRAALLPPPESLSALADSAPAPQLLDRHGTPLNVTFENAWNLHARVPLHAVPAFLRLAFIHAEDKRFYAHGGPDWRARISAAAANVANLEVVRGASTISEQVVRMLRPRPRTVWVRWLEGFEAAALERSFTKDEILEFYLNQVPYAANRRGVGQAANYYFARDLDTLSMKEMLALAVLVRSPSRLDPYRSDDAIDGPIARLADLMLERGAISEVQRDWILADELELTRPSLAVAAPHFVRFVESRLRAPSSSGASSRASTVATVRTTLDAGLQRRVQRFLDQRLAQLRDRRVEHGAVLVVDNASREVLAWAVGGGAEAGGPKTHIDTVLSPRQPGSALKPFLYELALEQGWTAAQVIEDAPLAASIGAGQHRYQNYSRQFYGPVSLRDALGNSLNIPALKTLRFVGAERYLERLAELGFAGLDAHPDVYGDGIALGNGAVTLFELVQAYVALANAGTFAPLTVLAADYESAGETRPVLSQDTASLIANILSDPEARALEFGRQGVLSYPTQTAVKTGTSSDFRDSWVVGFNTRFTVGVWLGNLDQSPTDGLTGSTGPALLLRAILSELMRGLEPEPLFLSARLRQSRVCVPMPGAPVDCIERDEWFAPGTAPTAGPALREAHAQAHAQAQVQAIRFRQPLPGLELAMDPRLPAESQALEFGLDGVAATDEVHWLIDGERVISRGASYIWPLRPGVHAVSASVFREREPIASLRSFDFVVK